MALYGVNTDDGFAQDFEAQDDQRAIQEAERILREERTCPPAIRYEIWETESDTLVAEGMIS